MRLEFLLLEEILRRDTSPGPVYYLPNPGNWGDALIRYATERFLRDAGISYTLLRGDGQAQEVRTGGVLLYGGGGRWCRIFDHSVELLQRIAPLFRKIFVLPSSYQNSYSLPNTTFFRRDDFESREFMPTALFCHDMSFYLGSFQAGPGQGEGWFFRTDAESARDGRLPPGNQDISTRGDHRSDIYPFLAEIARSAVIHTDRLHVAIAACLLGREVHLYPGAYFKNRAVFHSSIQGYYDNVIFHEG